MSEPDDRLEMLIAELKRPEPVDPTAVDRVMDAVRGAKPPLRDRVWGWLTLPRQVAVSPLGLAAVVVALVVIIRLGALLPGSDQHAPVPEGHHPVQFVFQADGATSVSLVGDFNNWDPRALPLTRTGVNGIWSVVVPLPPGRHVYAFVVDGRVWMSDQYAPRAPEDEFGRANSVILVEKT